jgi:TetR/AcrR family transcriptional regulator, regulator of autoinduction and epiphytic fitness
MKISREQKASNRLAFINAASQLMSADGMRETTLKEVARAAGMNEQAIYRYFPTKDHLLAAYFADTLGAAIAKISVRSEFSGLRFVEQIHTLLDELISEYETKRPFVNEAFRTVFMSGLSSSMAYLEESKKTYVATTRQWLEAAVAAGEYRSSATLDLMVELLWDFQLGLTYYWLKDTSEQSTRTLQLLDRSLKIFDELLKSKLVEQISDLFYFIVREHFMKFVDKGLDLSQSQKDIKSEIFRKNEEEKNKFKTKPKARAVADAATGSTAESEPGSAPRNPAGSPVDSKVRSAIEPKSKATARESSGPPGESSAGKKSRSAPKKKSSRS